MNSIGGIQINFRTIASEQWSPWDDEDDPEMVRKWREDYAGKVMIRASILTLPDKLTKSVESQFFDPEDSRERREALREVWKRVDESIKRAFISVDYEVA